MTRQRRFDRFGRKYTFENVLECALENSAFSIDRNGRTVNDLGILAA
jgi:hypothetical protein